MAGANAGRPLPGTTGWDGSDPDVCRPVHSWPDAQEPGRWGGPGSYYPFARLPASQLLSIQAVENQRRPNAGP